ncbi:MAG TPA: DUF881 domain-containing protein [Candidatus Bathyarchaeia archaeon]|nr:DUF881 domain-containing protein [Candidatus Bathyarchaeia archaeon]
MITKNRKITFILSLISAIIGIMFAIQIKSNMNPVSTESRSIAELRSSLQKELEKHKGLLADISKYNLLFYQYESSLNEGDSVSVMKEELARAKKMAGMIGLEGEGTTIRIHDAVIPEPPPLSELEQHTFVPNAVIDEDLRWLSNILFANGATAVSINGHRIIATTAIRNVGEDIQIDTKTIRPPYEIKALGDPDVLISGLKLEGAEENLKLAGKQLIIEKRDKLLIPAYTDDRVIRFMKPVKTKGES